MHPFTYRLSNHWAMPITHFEVIGIALCQICDDIQDDSESPATVLFSVKAYFTTESSVNMHNAHMWSSKNYHSTVQFKVQHNFGINNWARILENPLIRPCLLPEGLNGSNYLVFRQHDLMDSMHGIQVPGRQIMQFNRDGVPAHFVIVMCKVNS